MFDLNSSDFTIDIGLGIYNEEKLISRMLDSIMQQTHSNFRLIISDDCSTDQTYSICQKYKINDHRIELYKQEDNIGVSNNLAFLFNKSKNNFFIYLAGDDYLSKDYLEVNLRNLIKNPTSSCSASKNIWDNQDKMIKKNWVDISIEGNFFERINKFFDYSFLLTAMNYAIYRRNIIQTCPNLSKKFLGHDWKIMTHALSKGSFVRSEDGYIVLGRGGISSAPGFMKREVNFFIEHIFPLYEYSMYFINNILRSEQLSFFQRFKLISKLIKINMYFQFLKFLNIFKVLIRGIKHHKIGPAYIKK